MYAISTKTKPDKAFGFKLPEDHHVFHVWRKHPDLHGWMEALYLERGGQGTFNCAPLVLTAEDLNRLEDALRSKDLPDTSGFFFGETTGEELADDLVFIEKARLLMAGGFTIIYDSWW